MSRHPQLSRQQLTDLLDHAFDELEGMKALMKDANRENEGWHIVDMLEEHIDQLLKSLTEHK